MRKTMHEFSKSDVYIRLTKDMRTDHSPEEEWVVLEALYNVYKLGCTDMVNDICTTYESKTGE